ncbi:MAG: glycosyltransferase, partial [Gemmatimonadales bacterium]
MRFSVDAHAIGCQLTGNEVYIQNLLNELSRLISHADDESELIAYVSRQAALPHIPRGIETRLVSGNPYKRLGMDFATHLRRDRPDVLHVQYTGPAFSSAPLVVSVHDVSYLEYPEYFTRFRSTQLRLTVQRTVRRAARILTPSEFS